MSSAADRGLLITLHDLVRATGRPPSTEEIAAAVGIPQAYSELVERRLEANLRRGFVERTPNGRWRPTVAGIAAGARAEPAEVALSADA